MPRKKLDPTTAEETSAVSPKPTAKPTRTRKASVTPAVEPAPIVPAEVTKPKRLISAKAKTTPVVETVETPTPAPTPVVAKKAPAAKPATAAIPVAATAVAPAKKGPITKAKAVKPEPVATPPVVAEPVVEVKAETTKPTKAKKPVAAKAKVEPVAVLEAPAAAPALKAPTRLFGKKAATPVATKVAELAPVPPAKTVEAKEEVVAPVAETPAPVEPLPSKLLTPKERAALLKKTPAETPVAPAKKVEAKAEVKTEEPKPIKVVPPATKLFGRAKAAPAAAPVVEAVVTEPVAVAASAPEPIETVEASAEEKVSFVLEGEEIPVTFRGRSRDKAREPAQAAVVEPIQPAEPVVEAPSSEEAVAVDDERGIQISFRPRIGGKPVRRQAAAVEVPKSEPAPTAKPAEPETPPVMEFTEGDETIVVLEWRSRGTARSKPAADRSAESGASTTQEEDGGRDRRRNRRGRPERSERPSRVEVRAEIEADEEEELSEAPSTATPAPTITITERPAPVVKKPDLKPLISIPDDAPQVVVRNGVPQIVRNHRIYPPVMFFGAPSDEKRAETVLDELRMAAESGIHLHSFLLELVVDLNEIDATASFAAYLLAQAVERDPETQVVFRLSFAPPRNWEAKYPKSVYRNAEGYIAEPSASDDDFWGVAEECLRQFVKKLRLLDLRDNILGVHLERGEWFFAQSVGYDTSAAARHKFRDWARRRYSNDETTLHASWFDGSVRFDNIQVPEFQPDGTSDGDKFIRSSRRQRRYVDYHLFLSDMMVTRVTDLAYAAKAASQGNFLVGVSYGYTFEWSHPSSGHLGLGKLLRTPEIDFIAGPPSYKNREPGGSAPFPGPIDSFALNGKLYISEEDFKTSLSQGQEQDDFNPRLRTPQALEYVHWRGVGAALAHGSGVNWMDQWGNGWLRTNSVWERANQVREAFTQRAEAPLGDPEVAVFIDERALAYLVDSNAFTLLVQNVRESVLRSGMSAAFYLLSDLAHREKFPDSKLYIFVNAWDIRPELRAAIKSRLQRDGKVLFWLYAAGLFDAGRDSLERAREVTGIALKPQPFYSKAGTTIINRRHPLSQAFPDRSLIGGAQLEPSYFAIPEGAQVLGEYTQTGLPSFVVKEFNEDANSHWTSVFLGEPLVNPALIRALGQMAGCHVWNFQEDVVHVRAPFCTVHCTGTGPRTIILPDKFSAYSLTAQDWLAVDTTHLKFHATDGSTHVFLVGPKADIQHLLDSDPAKVLHMENLPPREQNVRIDSSNFDVPIMRLDQWVQGNDQDEVADEWFLRAPQMGEEDAPSEQAQATESPEQVGKRRRRRRRGKGGNGRDHGDEIGSDEIATARFEPASITIDDMSLNVVFRKRE